MQQENHKEDLVTRRDFFSATGRGIGIALAGGVSTLLLSRGAGADVVWQIDPYKCTQCGKCATECVLEVSAVKCMHAFDVCGYCKLCTGFFEPEPNELNTGAENQLCPVRAIQRTFIEDPYFEYKIDDALCIGCGKCVKGCATFGNGSLYLQVRHDICLHCNECAIALACPSGAFTRVSADHPYLPKTRGR